MSNRTRRFLAGGIAALVGAAGVAVVGDNASAHDRVDGFTLTIIHNNDGESALLPSTIDDREYGGVARFITEVKQVRRQTWRTWDPGESWNRGYVTLNSGDNFLAGLTREASNEAGVDYDALAVQQIGYDALAVGNHEFDFGSETFASFAQAIQPHRWWNKIPLVSANLDYSNDPATRDLKQLVPSTVLHVFGQKVGVVGLTTETLREISSPGLVEVNPDLAGVAQAEIDKLTAKGIDKIILISHLQGIDSEIALLTSLRDVDVVIGGGGGELLADPGDELVPGDEEDIVGSYPAIGVDADGNEVPVVTTPGDYRYLGVLQITFDRNGEVVDIDTDDSGLRVIDDSNRPNKRAVRTIQEPVAEARAALEAQVVATTEVVLDNSRAFKRVREANIGNLIADAHLAGATAEAAAAGLPTPQVFFMNGGGIRGSDLDVPVGPISVADTFGLQPFRNFLSIAENVSFADIRAIVENGLVRGVGVADGGFIQVSDGTRVVINADATVGEMTLADGTVVVAGGVTQTGTATIAQLNFSIGGGDGQPDLTSTPGVTVTQTPLGDQVSLRNYLESIGTVTAADYPNAGEGRILFNCGGAAPQQEACAAP